MKGRWLENLAFGAWAVLTAALTLAPSDAPPSVIQPLCLLCGAVGGADLVRNILLFAPAGFLLSRRGVSVMTTVGLGLAFSAAIELAQMFVPGRFPTLRDVLTNGGGTAVGALFHLSMAHGLNRGSRRLYAGAIIYAVAAVGLTGWLLQPVSADGAYFAQWVPQRPHYAPWTGRVLSATIGALPMNIGRLDATDAIRRQLRRGEAVQVRFINGEPPARLTAIFALVDDSRREALMIGVDGDDVVIRPRVRASDARLHLVGQRIPNALAGYAAADTVTLAVTVDPHGVACVRHAEQHACAPAHSLGAAWRTIIRSTQLTAPITYLLDAVTVFLLLLPLALLSAVQPPARAVVTGVLTLAACVMAGRLFGLAWPGLAECTAAAIAVGVALVTRRTLRVHG